MSARSPGEPADAQPAGEPRLPASVTLHQEDLDPDNASPAHVSQGAIPEQAPGTEQLAASTAKDTGAGADLTQGGGGGGGGSAQAPDPNLLPSLRPPAAAAASAGQQVSVLTPTLQRFQGQAAGDASTQPSLQPTQASALLGTGTQTAPNTGTGTGTGTHLALTAQQQGAEATSQPQLHGATQAHHAGMTLPGVQQHLTLPSSMHVWPHSLQPPLQAMAGHMPPPTASHQRSGLPGSAAGGLLGAAGLPGGMPTNWAVPALRAGAPIVSSLRPSATSSAGMSTGLHAGSNNAGVQMSMPSAFGPARAQAAAAAEGAGRTGNGHVVGNGYGNGLPTSGHIRNGYSGILGPGNGGNGHHGNGNGNGNGNGESVAGAAAPQQPYGADGSGSGQGVPNSTPQSGHRIGQSPNHQHCNHHQGPSKRARIGASGNQPTGPGGVANGNGAGPSNAHAAAVGTNPMAPHGALPAIAPRATMPGILTPGPCPRPVPLAGAHLQGLDSWPVLPYIEKVEMSLAKGSQQPLTFHRQITRPLTAVILAVMHHLGMQDTTSAGLGSYTMRAMMADHAPGRLAFYDMLTQLAATHDWNAFIVCVLEYVDASGFNTKALFRMRSENS